jgi:hypothetical protein
MHGEKSENAGFRRESVKARATAFVPDVPDDASAVEPSIANHPFATVQDHSVSAGVGQAFREILNFSRLACPPGGHESNRENVTRNALVSLARIK